jgi:flagellum-specific peptidoglycan hydrolase FlgJ
MRGEDMNIRQWYISKVLITSAYRAKKITGLPASIVSAQCILETNWLKSIPKDIDTEETSNNLFGIKAHTHPYVECMTTEYIKGVKVGVLAKFKKYRNYEESFVSYGKLILENERYKKAVAVKDNPREYIKEIFKAGYATDPDYPQKVIGIAENCGYIPK